MMAMTEQQDETRGDATRTTDDIVINVSELRVEPAEVAVLFFLYHSTTSSCPVPLLLFALLCLYPLPSCGTRQRALRARKPRRGPRR